MSHTKEAGALPNAAIDFGKVQSAAMAGKKDPYNAGVVEDVPNSLTSPADGDKVAAASRVVALREAGIDAKAADAADEADTTGAGSAAKK